MNEAGLPAGPPGRSGPIAIAGALALLWLLLPFAGLVSRVPWTRLADVFVRPDFLDSLLLSLWTCLLTTALVFVIGLPLALWIGHTPRLAPMARILVLLPMTLPPVVAGLALMATFGRRGILGPALSVLGIELSFTTAAVIMAQVFVALPFFVVAVESALRVLDPAPQRALAFLGASPGSVLRSATVPALAPAITSGLALAFARALGEFGATLTFAGSLQGVTRTMPLSIYLARESDPELSYALAAVLIAVALLVISLGSWAAHRLSRPRRVRVPEAGEPEAVTAPAPISIAVDDAGRGVHVNLSVPAGQVVALVGANGSGKSTVLEWTAREARSAAALQLQDPALLGHLTALDNVALGPRIHGESRGRARRVAIGALTQVGAAPFAARGPGQLSGGERARVALARSLSVGPAIVLLDEPTAALDVESAAGIREVLGHVLTGRSAVVVTHDVLDVARLADRVVVLDGGRIVEDGTTPEVLTAPRSRFAQSLAGVNALRGVVGQHGDRVAIAGSELGLEAGAGLPAAGTEVLVHFAPGDAHLLDHPAGATGASAPGGAGVARELVLSGTAAGLRPGAGVVRAEIAFPDGQSCAVDVSATRAVELVEGEPVRVVIRAPRVSF